MRSQNPHFISLPIQISGKTSAVILAQAVIDMRRFQIVIPAQHVPVKTGAGIQNPRKSARYIDIKGSWRYTYCRQGKAVGKVI